MVLLNYPTELRSLSYLEWKAGKTLCHEQRTQGKREGSNVINFSREVLFKSGSFLLFIFQRTDQTQVLSRDDVLRKMKQNPNDKAPLACGVRAGEIPTGLSAAQCLLWNVKSASCPPALRLPIQPHAYTGCKDTFTFPTIYKTSILFYETPLSFWKLLKADANIPQNNTKTVCGIAFCREQFPKFNLVN